MMSSQSGQALPLAIMALAIGSLVVAPFLGYAGTDLIGSRVYGESIEQQSACDAGIEHAIWSLTKGDLSEQFTQPGDIVTYQLGETINGLTTSITVTANATDGGSAGDITDTVINTLEFDNSSGYEPSITNVSDNIYAIAYRGWNNRGYLVTISVDADGDIGNSVIDTLTFDFFSGYEPCLVHVSGDIYAVAYQGWHNRGYLKTVSIATNGDISYATIDTLTFDSFTGYEPCLVHVSGDIYAIAYRGWRNQGYLKTVSIATNGDIGYAILDTLTFENFNGYEPHFVCISSNIYAIAYRGWHNRGYLKTVSIATNGDIGYATIDTLTFDTSDGYEPRIINVSNDIYAIAHRGWHNRGYLKTVSITTNGDIGYTTIDTLTFDTSDGYEPRIINVSDDIYVIVYRSRYNRGMLTTISIDTDGYIASDVIDTMQFDVTCYEPVIINILGNIYAIAYRGSGNDGFIKTIEITGMGGVASYEIVATASDSTLRALVNIDNSTTTIVSWQIE